MKRFQWKLLSVMLMVSVVPLAFSAVLVNQLFRDAVTLAFDQEVKDDLDQATKTHRSYIKLRRRALTLETNRLMHDPALLTALNQDTGVLRAHLEGWIQQVEDPDMRVASVAVRSITPGGDSRPPSPSTAPQKTTQDADVLINIDERAKYEAHLWRSKAVKVRLKDADGRAHELSVTWAVPWAMFKRFEEAGKVRRTVDNMAKRQNALTRANTVAFAVLAGAILCVTFLAGVLMARATTKRLALLANATAQVGRGDLDIQVPVRGQDEIAQLTDAFNKMVVELRQARDRLAYLERVSTWQEIARRLAHEIKNPLTPILLAIQQLDRKFNDYRDQPGRYRRLVSDAVEIVGEEVDSLRTLVQEFSDFARLPQVVPAPTDAAQWTRELLRTNPQLASHVEGVEVVDEDPDAPIMTALDNTMMRRAMINLMVNAQQAVDNFKGEAARSVRVKVERLSEGGARFVVEDRGPGVSAEHLEQLFNPYFTTKSDGTGLGLTIVKKIILDHGGDIRCESPIHDDHGARFIIDLPHATSAEAQALTDADTNDDAEPT